MRTFASLFAERGYTTLEIDLGLPTDSVDAKSSDALLHHFEAGESRAAAMLNQLSEKQR